MKEKDLFKKQIDELNKVIEAIDHNRLYYETVIEAVTENVQNLQKELK